MQPKSYLSSSVVQTMNLFQSNRADLKDRHWRVTTLCFVLLAMVCLWGFVLPRLAERPAMRDKMERLRKQGIDPAAFFYSDHPAAFQPMPSLDDSGDG